MRRLLVVVAVVAAVLVVADRVLVVVASRLAAGHIDARDAHVTIHGFPFLTQVAGGRLDHVTVSGRDVRRDGVTVDRFTADQYAVHLDVGAAIGGSTSVRRIDRASGTAVITYAGLSASIAGRTHVTLSLEPRDDRDLTARVRGPFGSTLSVPVPVPTVADGKLEVGGLVQKIVPLVPDQVADLAEIPLPSLPYGLRLQEVTPQRDGLHLSVTGSDVPVPTRA